MQQRPVVEVGPQGDEHPHRAVGFSGRGGQQVQEVLPLGRVAAGGKQLLKLVDDQQQVGLVVRQHQPGGPDQAVGIAPQLLV